MGRFGYGSKRVTHITASNKLNFVSECTVEMTYLCSMVYNQFDPPHKHLSPLNIEEV